MPIGFDPIQHLTRFGNQENTFGFATTPVVKVEAVRIGVPQAEPAAPFWRNTGRQGTLDTRALNSGLSVVLAYTPQVGAVGQRTARIVAKPVPLLEEVISHMVANLVQLVAMGVADFVDVRRINDDLAAVGDGWLHLIHPLS